MEKVRNFSNFNKDNDPNGEHDFGAFDVNGITYFWKIDYYDVDYQYLSLDPSDETITNRVLTVMLAEEYQEKKCLNNKIIKIVGKMASTKFGKTFKR